MKTVKKYLVLTNVKFLGKCDNQSFPSNHVYNQPTAAKQQPAATNEQPTATCVCKPLCPKHPKYTKFEPRKWQPVYDERRQR